MVREEKIRQIRTTPFAATFAQFWENFRADVLATPKSLIPSTFFVSRFPKKYIVLGFKRPKCEEKQRQ